MINIDFKQNTYTCPYCGHEQAFTNSMTMRRIGLYPDHPTITEKYQESTFDVYTFGCCNNACSRICVTAINCTSKAQFDILPSETIKCFPAYIPLQIRADYEEGSAIIEKSAKAAATLFRRCLQGMIHDFWGIHEKDLNAEITMLNDKVTPAQWKAIDGLRKIGNIGAHMEHDVNLIIDIDAEEAKKLQKFIELLIDKWYIARHDEETLLSEITEISEVKTAQRQGKS